jgi:hypothetical protein
MENNTRRDMYRDLLLTKRDGFDRMTARFFPLASAAAFTTSFALMNGRTLYTRQI